MRKSLPAQPFLATVKTTVALGISILLWAGCNRQSGQGGSQGDNPPVTGRGSGEHGDSGGNGKVYDRGGPPNIVNSHDPGTGRVDKGGGPTTGLPPSSSTATNSTSQTNQP
jgi:hypothetical protein